MVSATQRYALQHCALALLLMLPLVSHAEVLVVIGAHNAPFNLSKNQVRDVFLGRVSSLPNGHNAILIDQPESSSLRDEFYLAVMNKSASQAKAYWAQLSFTGGGSQPLEGKDSADVKRMLNSTPGAIGYIERSALDSSVKVVFELP